MKKKILFIHNALRTFVRIDFEIFQSQYEVTELYFKSKRMDLFRIWKEVERHDLTFIWFASWYAFFPALFCRLLSRPCVVVTGGYETVNLPEINFGFQRLFLKRIVVNFILNSASAIVVNSNFSRDEFFSNIRITRDKVAMIYHGLDPEEYPFSQDKEKLVISVGNVNQEDLKRKGMENFVRAAQYLPGVPFVLIGNWADSAIHFLKKIASPNVAFTGYLPQEKMIQYLRKAKVYVQASMHEAFGLSLAEAMLCGCIPVVSRKTALPEVVGDIGVYVKPESPEDIARGIEEALRCESDRSYKSRDRIALEFPLEKRKRALLQLVENLLDKNKDA